MTNYTAFNKNIASLLCLYWFRFPMDYVFIYVLCISPVTIAWSFPFAIAH